MDSQSTRLRLHFVDSSDEGASHYAAMQLGTPGDDGDVSADGRQPYGSSGSAESHSGDRKKGSWLSNAFYNGMNATANFLLGAGGGGGGGGGIEEQHEPYGPDLGASATVPPQHLQAAPPPHNPRHPERNGGPNSSSDSGEWEFGSSHRRGNVSETSESPSLPEMPGGMAEEGDGYDQVSLDLRDTVLLFLQTGSDVFMNIILATLKASNELVDGETFEIVSGNPTLLRLFLDSGRVDVDDPRVQAIVQSKLDELLAGDPYAGDVIPGELLDYVRCLCNVKTSRINFQQMILIRYSGFDYIELLIDYPYLLEGVKRPRLCTRIVFAVLHYISIITSWFGVLVALMFAAMVLWTVVFWFQQPENRNNGYWTIIAYIGGYMVSLVVTMRAEEGKITRYDNQVWSYPNNNLRIVPIYPHYEVMLSYISLRYEISADAKRFFIIRCDLRNGILLQQMCNGLFFAMPQVVLQTFLYTDRAPDRSYLSAVVYWLLLGSCCALMLMSVFACYDVAVFTHSCNSQGFAILSTQGNVTGNERTSKALRHRATPSDVSTNVLLFFTLYFFIAEAVMLLISLLNLNSCDGGQVTFLAIWVAVIGCSIIFIVVARLYLPIRRTLGFVAFPAVLMQIAFFIYRKNETDSTSCVLFRTGYSGWMIPSVACFGLVCVSIVVWGVVVVVELIRRARIPQNTIDQYLFS